MIRRVLAVAAIAALALPVNAAERMDRLELYAKEAFSVLYSFPRPNADIAVSRGYFADSASFAGYVEYNYRTPFSFNSYGPDLKVTYSFPAVPGWFKVGGGSDVVRIGFYAKQHVNGPSVREARCFAVTAAILEAERPSLTEIQIAPVLDEACVEPK